MARRNRRQFLEDSMYAAAAAAVAGSSGQVLGDNEPQSKSLVMGTVAFLATIAVLFAVYKFLLGR